MIGRMGAPSVSVMLKSWDIRVGTTGEMVLDAARHAEALGLDGIIAGDHVTFYGYGNDGLITLTAAAAVTERIELKTAVYLLPLRHPVPVALQVAQLDQLSMGGSCSASAWAAKTRTSSGVRAWTPPPAGRGRTRQSRS